MDITWKVGVTALLACLFGVLGSVVPARAAIVDLDIFISDTANQLLDGQGNPLADGSWVFIMGSGDNINDGMESFGTNLIASSTINDDVILGFVQIDSSIFGAGTFSATVPYDTDDINEVYIRFFNTNTLPIEGYVEWGTSTVFTIPPPVFGVSTYDIDEQFQVQNTNNFVIIPEPSTFSFLILAGGMLWVMRSGAFRNLMTMDVPQQKSTGDPP